MSACYERERPTGRPGFRGKETKTDMSERELEKFASKKSDKKD